MKREAKHGCHPCLWWGSVRVHAVPVPSEHRVCICWRRRKEAQAVWCVVCVCPLRTPFRYQPWFSRCFAHRQPNVSSHCDVCRTARTKRTVSHLSVSEAPNASTTHEHDIHKKHSHSLCRKHRMPQQLVPQSQRKHRMPQRRSKHTHEHATRCLHWRYRATPGVDVRAEKDHPRAPFSVHTTSS